MDEQMKFRTALAALSALAEQKNRRLNKSEVQEFFQDMDFNEEQYQLVYSYLASKRIQVEGMELPKVAEEISYTTEEQEFLNQYKLDLKYRKKQADGQLPELLKEAANGEEQAKEKLVEHYMERVLDIANAYVNQGLLLQDLVQEGNLGLVIAIDTLGLVEGMEFEAHIENEIHRAIRAAMDEQAGAKGTGEEITDKLNKLADSITSLTEDLNRQVSPEELSVYLDMPLEEIENLLRIAGETIEVAET